MPTTDPSFDAVWARSPEVLAVDQLRQRQSLLPDLNVLTRIPKLYGTEAVSAADKTVWAHYFMGPADWFICELDPASGLAFGYACLGDPQLAEWGYVSLAELAGLKVQRHTRIIMASELGDDWRPQAHNLPMTLVVERDAYWEPVKAGECERIQQIRQAGGAWG